MHFLLVTSLLVSAYLVGIIAKINPFDRTLGKKKYQIIRSREFIPGEGHLETSCITFCDGASHDTVRTAVYDSRYSDPHLTCIKFTNFPRGFYPIDHFSDFFFSCIDLSSVDFAANSLDYDSFIIVSDQLPCRRLILPKSIRQVNLSDHCPSLETLVIPADYFVPVHWMCLPYEDPILVHRNFKIAVPKHLLSVYQSDSQWNRVIFIDDDCLEFHPTFESLS